MYNAYVVPVYKNSVPKVFLLHNGTREGRSASHFAILWITLSSWDNQSVPFGFFI
jgi:hypothetical protein